jgi:hypothetical protein
MKALRSFSFFKSKDKGSSGEASSPRSGESTPTSPTNSASLSNLFPGDGTPMGVDPNGVQNADGPPVGVDPNSLEEKQVKFAAATAAEAPAVQEQSSPGRTDSKKLDRKDSAGTLKKTKSDHFGRICRAHDPPPAKLLVIRPGPCHSLSLRRRACSGDRASSPRNPCAYPWMQ